MIKGKVQIGIGVALTVIIAIAVFGCAGAKDMIPDIPVNLAQVPLDQVGLVPVPVKAPTKEAINKVYVENYDFTFYDKAQRIEKEVKICNSDTWYEACVNKDKIVVKKLKTKEVVKTIKLGKVDFIGNLNIGGGFFSVIMAEKKLHVLYYKYVIKPGAKPARKIVRKTYSLEKLELGDKPVTVAIRKQAAPGYSIWLCTVNQKEELALPLYEINFVGSDNKIPFVKQLVAEIPGAAPAVPAVPDLPAVPEKPELPDMPAPPTGL